MKKMDHYNFFIWYKIRVKQRIIIETDIYIHIYIYMYIYMYIYIYIY